MRLGLRARITALLLLLSVVPPAAVVWIIRERVLGLVRSEDVGRMDDALAEFDAAIEREGKDAGEALSAVARLLQDDPRYQIPATPRRTGTPVAVLPADTVRRLMMDGGLDCLSILDAAGMVLSSGHAPQSAGRTEDDRLLLPESSTAFIEEEITPGIGRVLTLQSRRAVDFGGATLHLVGGRFIDADFLRRLSPGGTVKAILLDRGGAILAASDPGNPLPVPPGWNDPAAGGGQLDVRGAPHAFRMIRLHDRQGSTVGSLVAAVSLERIAQLSSALGTVALVVVVTGILGSLLLGGALARGVTGPLRRLEDMSRRIAQERYEPVADREGPGEVVTLTSAFNRMARSLAESRQRLRQTERLAAAEEVARRVAHEIKNPLSPIALTLEGLARTRKMRPAEFDAAFDEAVRTIKDEIGRMRGILEDFSRFGRLPVPRPRPADLNAVIRNTLTLFAENSARARIVADLEPGLATVVIDPDRMSEVINNLVGNAVQAMGEEGGTVTVSTRSGSAGAEMRVRDTGPGLPENVRRRLFEPYVAARPGGTGLGMAIARRIVLDHGGRIEAGNHPEGGAEIAIVLPWGGPAAEETGPVAGTDGREDDPWRRS